jgi:hypothetical protein
MFTGLASAFIGRRPISMTILGWLGESTRRFRHAADRPAHLGHLVGALKNCRCD